LPEVHWFRATTAGKAHCQNCWAWCFIRVGCRQSAKLFCSRRTFKIL
jgi:hypothetical protein